MKPEEIREQLKKLNEDLNNAFAEFRKSNDDRLAQLEERSTATGETVAKVEEINAAMTEIREQMGELEKRLNRPKIETRNGATEISEEEMEKREAFVEYCRRGTDNMEMEKRNALSSASDADGGFLVPPSFESGIIMEAYDMAEIRPYTQVGTTGRDQVYIGALSKPLVAWGRTQLKVSTQKLNAGVRRIQIFDLKALALIHNNTLDDSDADIFGELSAAFALAIAEAEDVAFAVGGGDESPQGVVADAEVQANYVPTGVAADITDGSNNGVDALMDVFYKVKKTYRRAGIWGFNSTTEAAIRKLKDADGRYLWQPPVQAGEPAVLLGKPTINPEGMPDIAANAFPVFFGDLRAGYKIRDRAGMSVRRLAERYAEYDQTGFMIKKRLGGMVTLAEAFACLKVAAS
jgi:HK97 family phage major capsid protein